jgi:alkylation response protein AidB-like acyl-CoA dehydrogenase
MIDFTLSPEQNEIRSRVARLSSDFLANAYRTYENYPTQRERFQALRPFYGMAAKAGLIKGLIPRRLGGTGGTVTDAALLVEGMIKADRSLSLTIFSTGLGLSPLLIAGTKEQHEKFLNPFLTSEGEPLASLLWSEPHGTANWLEKGGSGLKTTAKKDSDDWIINGEKVGVSLEFSSSFRTADCKQTWASNSCGWDDIGADIQCVVCQYSEDGQPQDLPPAEKMMILLITRQDISMNVPGAFEVVKHLETSGLSSTAGPHIRLLNFRVPGNQLLAAPGAAAAIITRSFTSSAALVGAMATGIMSAAFEAALEFAKTDSRGGAHSLLSRQSVSDLLIDIKMRTDASRMLTWKACNALDNGKGGELAFEAKVFCSEMAIKAVVDAMAAVGM